MSQYLTHPDDVPILYLMSQKVYTAMAGFVSHLFSFLLSPYVAPQPKFHLFHCEGLLVLYSSSLNLSLT